MSRRSEQCDVGLDRLSRRVADRQGRDHGGLDGWDHGRLAGGQVADGRLGALLVAELMRQCSNSVMDGNV